jgi:ribosomal protein L18E
LAFFSFFNDHLIFFYLYVVWAVVSGIGMLIKPRDVAALNLDGKAEKKFAKAMGGVKKEMIKGALKG